METTRTTHDHPHDPKETLGHPGRRAGACAALLGVVALAAPAMADDPSGSRILECRSGIVTDGDVSDVGALATRVPAAQLPDTTPGDCSLR